MSEGSQTSDGVEVPSGDSMEVDSSTGRKSEMQTEDRKRTETSQADMPKDDTQKKILMKEIGQGDVIPMEISGKECVAAGGKVTDGAQEFVKKDSDRDEEVAAKSDIALEDKTKTAAVSHNDACNLEQNVQSKTENTFDQIDKGDNGHVQIGTDTETESKKVKLTEKEVSSASLTFKKDEEIKMTKPGQKESSNVQDNQGTDSLNVTKDSVPEALTVAISEKEETSTGMEKKGITELAAVERQTVSLKPASESSSLSEHEKSTEKQSVEETGKSDGGKQQDDKESTHHNPETGTEKTKEQDSSNQQKVKTEVPVPQKENRLHSAEKGDISSKSETSELVKSAETTGKNERTLSDVSSCNKIESPVDKSIVSEDTCKVESTSEVSESNVNEITNVSGLKEKEEEIAAKRKKEVEKDVKPEKAEEKSLATLNQEKQDERTEGEKVSTELSTDSSVTGKTTEEKSTELSIDSSVTGKNTAGRSTELSTDSSVTGKNTEGKSTEFSTDSSITRKNTEEKSTELSTDSSITRKNTEEKSTELSTDSSVTGKNTEGQSTELSTDSSVTGKNTEEKSTELSTDSSITGKNTEGKSTELSTDSSITGKNTEGKSTEFSTDSSITGTNTEGNDKPAGTENQEKTSQSVVSENINKEENQNKDIKTRKLSQEEEGLLSGIHVTEEHGKAGDEVEPMDTSENVRIPFSKPDTLPLPDESSNISIPDGSSVTSEQREEGSILGSMQDENSRMSFLEEASTNMSMPDESSNLSVPDSYTNSGSLFVRRKPFDISMFDDDAMMSRPETPSSVTTETPSECTPAKKRRRGSTDSVTQDVQLQHFHRYPAENLFEYQWPQESGAEWYMLQEQLCEYLAIKSFKRKYPELQRRVCDKLEKDFLRDKGVVTETQSDLGLTALKSEEVYELMHRDYPDKYQEYCAVLHERERQSISDKHKDYAAPKLEKSKMKTYMKKAMKSASEWNHNFLKERWEERRAYFDMQTFSIHYPVNRYKKLTPEATEVGPYPVSLIPGQFQDYYKKYNKEELKYFPLNTSMYDPPKRMENNLAKMSDADSEDQEDDQRKGSSVSSSDSDDDSSSSDSNESASTSATKGETAAKENSQEESAEKEKTPVEAETKECRICVNMTEKEKKKKGVIEDEDLVQCSECKTQGHPSCLDLTEEMVRVIKTYPWQCMECKTCVECMDPYDEDKMLFCDRCDRGYHTFCVGLSKTPTGRWECHSCTGIAPLQAIPKPVKAKRGRKKGFSPKKEALLKKEREAQLKKEKEAASKDTPAKDTSSKDTTAKQEPDAN